MYWSALPITKLFIRVSRQGWWFPNSLFIFSYVSESQPVFFSVSRRQPAAGQVQFNANFAVAMCKTVCNLPTLPFWPQEMCHLKNSYENKKKNGNLSNGELSLIQNNLDNFFVSKYQFKKFCNSRYLACILVILVEAFWNKRSSIQRNTKTWN